MDIKNLIVIPAHKFISYFNIFILCFSPAIIFFHIHFFYSDTLMNFNSQPFIIYLLTLAIIIKTNKKE